MQKQTILKDRDYYKILIPIYAFGVLVFLCVLLFASWLSKKPFLEIIYELWPFLIIIPVGIIFLFILKLANRSSRKNKSIAKIENEFKKDLKLCIKQNLGKFALIDLNPDMNEMDVDQSSIIKKLLENEAKENIELKFYLYSLMGLYAIKSENVTKAIESFQTAISIRPDCIICKTWLAEAYELKGDGSQAIKTYKEILSKNGNIDSVLSVYFNEQIDIVTKKGPRKLPSMTGLRYVSY